MSKIWAISWVDVYRTFNDRASVMIMIAAPLAISLIIGAALGGGSNDIEIQEAHVGIINQDTGTFGDVYSCLLVEDLPSALRESCAATFGSDDSDNASSNDQNQITDFIDGEVIGSDIDNAREDVDKGDLDVLIIIPKDFSSGLFAREQVAIEVYYNAGGGIPVDVARSIIDGITTNINTSTIASRVIPDYAEASIADFSQADVLQLVGQVQAATNSANIDEIIQLERVNVEGEVEEFDALQFFAPGMAIFFMTFGMAFGARSILEDQRTWTMQRIMTTPTPRWHYLAGKTVGTFVTGLFQMVILIVATLLAGSLVFGSDAPVWGDSVVGIVLITVSVVLAGTGLGMILAALANDPEQANNISTIVLVLLAVIGGTFIPVDDVPIVQHLQKITLNHWGLDAFITLSIDEGSVGDILPNVAILLAMAAVYFVVAIALFRRRLDY